MALRSEACRPGPINLEKSTTESSFGKERSRHAFVVRHIHILTMPVSVNPAFFQVMNRKSIRRDLSNHERHHAEALGLLVVDETSGYQGSTRPGQVRQSDQAGAVSSAITNIPFNKKLRAFVLMAIKINGCSFDVKGELSNDWFAYGQADGSSHCPVQPASAEAPMRQCTRFLSLPAHIPLLLVKGSRRFAKSRCRQREPVLRKVSMSARGADASRDLDAGKGSGRFARSRCRQREPSLRKVSMSGLVLDDFFTRRPG